MDRFERLLRERINGLLEIRVQTLTMTGVDNFPEYRHNLGYIEALRHILDVCEDLRTELRNE
jgi:hypothetical protein